MAFNEYVPYCFITALCEKSFDSELLPIVLFRDAQVVKLLLLGAGESGKSTIVKQMKLLHAVDQREKAGFSDAERAEAAAAILDNIVDCVLALVEAMEVFAEEDGQHPDAEDQKLNNDKLKVD